MREHVAHVAEDDQVARRDAPPREGLEERGRAATGGGSGRRVAPAERDDRVLPLLDLVRGRGRGRGRVTQGLGLGLGLGVGVA